MAVSVKQSALQADVDVKKEHLLQSWLLLHNCLNSTSANGHNNTSDTSESDSEQSDIEEHIETEVITDTINVNIIDDLL